MLHEALGLLGPSLAAAGVGIASSATAFLFYETRKMLEETLGLFPKFRSVVFNNRIHLLTTKERHVGRSTLLPTTTLSGSIMSSSSDICFVLRSFSAPSRVQCLQSPSLHSCQTSYRSFFFYSFITKCCLIHNAYTYRISALIVPLFRPISV